MKDISKINVKHFLNKNLPLKQGEQILYPTYVKITFQRKSTEIKSTINKYFLSEEDSEFIHSYILVYEALMIQYFVKKGFAEQGDKFSLKGIAQICRNYHNKKIKDLCNSFVFDEFDYYLGTKRPKFWLILSNRIPSVGSYTYYEAALKLLDNDSFILQLKDKFDIVRDIESIKFAGFGELQDQPVIYWQFGQSKDMFELEAKDKRFSKQRISQIVDAIDSEIQKLSM